MLINLSVLSRVYHSIKTEIARYGDHVYRFIVGVSRPIRSEITPQVYVGGQYTKWGLKLLLARGITGIVSLRKTPPPPLRLEEITFLHLPTNNFFAPTMNQLREGVAFIERQVKARGKVYIHCAFGEGRGPTMAAAYLISQGFTLADALTKIKKVRPFIRPTQNQLQRLREYQHFLQARKKE